MYIKEILWILTWPVFVYIALMLSRYFVGKYEQNED
jgi:hypothetical protein